MRSQPLKGSNLTTVRGINERLIMHMIRIHGELTKAETSRLTDLSPNAVSVIFRALESEGLLLRGKPIRGRVGQPSIPMKLNPDARYYIGLKIGRRSFDLAIVNFVGDVIGLVYEPHAYPTPNNTIEFVQNNLQSLLDKTGISLDMVSALNVAMPFELWHWTDDFDAPRSEMEAWRDFDLKDALKKIADLPVTIENDGTAACRAELVFGPPIESRDFVYFFIGTFVGGGIVLNGSVYPGRRGSAGGFGPMRVPNEFGADRLVDHASLVILEHMVAEKEPAQVYQIYADNFDWNKYADEVDRWLGRASRSLAHSIVSALAVIDFETVIIDGALPKTIRQRLTRDVERHLDTLDMQGIVRPDIKVGHFGKLARVMGAAASQISTEYMIDQNRLLRETPTTIFKSQ